MSGGVKGGATTSRVSIPSSVKKTIENIKEITGQKHSEDEIYAMLKECSMDPNETAQNLLLLDTFHEVKRKRDRRKENLGKESAESKWNSGTEARPNRQGRGNYPSRHISHDAGGGRNLAAAKENATRAHLEKGTSNVPLATEIKKGGTSLVASPALPNGPSGTTSQNVIVIHNQSNATDNIKISKSEGPRRLSSPVNSITKPDVLKKDIQKHQIEDSTVTTKSIPSTPDSGSYFSSSDPVLLPSKDLSLHSAVGTIRREVGIQHSPIDNPTDSKSTSGNAASEVLGPNLQQKLSNDFQGVAKNYHLETTQPASSTIPRSSSNYNNRSQGNGPQKGSNLTDGVGSAKEWKPKSTNSSIGQGATIVASFEVSPVSVGSHPEPQPAPTLLTSRQDTTELQRKLEDAHISDRQHVIIPSHLHVPEAEKLGFCFGSFDVSFGLEMGHNDVAGSCKSSPLSESFEAIDEPAKDLLLSNQNVSATAEESEVNFPDQSHPPLQAPQSFPSSEVEVPSPITPEYSESKQETDSGHQHPTAHTSSNYNFGFMQQMPNGQFTPLECSESPAPDAPRLPSFVQPFDPTSYYAQLYRSGPSGMDTDGRISPFHSAGAANKFNGNNALMSSQTSQSPQEGGGSQVMSTTSPTPLVTQATGIMQSSIPTPQPLPIFRHPARVHLPHYPQNYYLPYGPYFAPFYAPPPSTIHQFFSNGVFPQQPHAGNLYPTPPGTTVKYPVSQYKQGSNTGNVTHIGGPGSYMPYGLSMAANYTSSSDSAAVTSISNADLAATQAKESNIYASGQQSEGSGVWFTASSQDISTLQASPFYNLPQGQLAFSLTQPGHGTYTSVFHPAQAAALLQQSQAITRPIDLVGPTGSVHQQQPHHTQINWPNNY